MQQQEKKIVAGKSALALPHTITPYLAVRDAVRAIEFYKKVFGATVSMRITDASGRVGHASLKFGDSEGFLSDEYPQIGVLPPASAQSPTFPLSLSLRNHATL